MTTHLRVGFIPLLDAALLIVAREEGFAEAEDIDLDLTRDVTWANLRDRLSIGHIDAAHLLAPAAIAANLGHSPFRVPLAAPVCLNRNGNAITVSRALYDALALEAGAAPTDPKVSAAALAKILAARRARRERERDLVFATVFPFSMHSIQLGTWLAGAGIAVGDGIRIEVLPPQFMATALEQGQIDGFCAGAPWNALTVARGHAAILHLGIDLIANAPEKVLAWRESELDARPAASDALVRALAAAARWCEAPENLPRLAALLARPAYLDVPADVLERLLAGHIAVGAGGAIREAKGFIRIDSDALRPRVADAHLIIDRMVATDLIKSRPGLLEVAERLFRADLFDRAVAE
jgi:NitT/TauT family transport system ATP-binding protein